MFDESAAGCTGPLEILVRDLRQLTQVDRAMIVEEIGEAEKIGDQRLARFRREVLQLVGARFARQGRAIVVRLVVNCIGVRVLRVGKQGLPLFLPVLVGHQPAPFFLGHRGVGDIVAAAVADGDRLQHVAKVVDGQRHRMADTWVGPLLSTDGIELSFVVEVDRLAGVAEVNGMRVRPLGLEALDRVVALGDAIGPVGGVGAVEGVDLLAEDRALEGATGLLGLLR